jgi:hypothetical protein
MRRLVTSLFAVLLLAPAARAHAAEDDLPVGNEAPRFVPIAVADTYYAYHDTSPGLNGAATLMTTANTHDDFAVNLAALGGRLEHAKLTGTLVLQAGTSVDALYVGARGNPEVWKHIQLANVGWKVGDFHVEAGVFPSLVGRESFVSTNNWNYTRPMVADSTPYYLAGARVTWRAAPTLTLNATVFNGWETYGDRNSAKSGQLRVAWAPSDKLSIEATTLAGQEQVHIEGEKTSYRLFEEVVFAAQLHERVHIALEAWAGTERNYRIEDPLKGDAAQASFLSNPWFYAGALWAKWDFGDTVYLAARAEALSDDAGLLTGIGARDPKEPFIGQKLAEGTLTFGWRPHKNILARVEGVHRLASNPYFAGSHNEYVETPATSPVPITYSTNARKSSTTFVASAAFAF